MTVGHAEKKEKKKKKTAEDETVLQPVDAPRPRERDGRRADRVKRCLVLLR